MRIHNLGFAAAAAAIGALGTTMGEGISTMGSLRDAMNGVPPELLHMIGPQRGHTQGSSRDVDHGRHRNRLARRARRQTRLYGHSATSRRALERASLVPVERRAPDYRTARYASA